MQSKSETYRFVCDVHLPASFPGEAGVLPLGPATLPDIDTGTLTVSIPEGGPANTVLHLEWVADLPFDEVLLQPTWRPSTGLPLLLPATGQRGASPVMFPHDSVLARLLRPLIVRIAFEANAPEFLRAFDEAPYQKLIPVVQVFVASYHLELAPMAVKVQGSGSPTRLLSSADVQTILHRKTNIYEYFATEADQHYSRLDNRSAIAWLTTTLEVAAYEHLGTRLQAELGRNDVPNFSPSEYLGKNYATIGGGRSLLTSDPLTFEKCEELWGARCELLHNGKPLIRTYNPKTMRADKKSLRPLHPADVGEFRRAVSAAVIWLRTA